MDDRVPSHLHGALSLIKECHETVEALFARFERTEDARIKSKIIDASLYELKIHATIEELLLHPALEPELIESDAERSNVRSLIAELESPIGDEGLRDARFAVLSENVRRHIREEEGFLFSPPGPDICRHELMERSRRPAVLALGALVLAGASASAQSNQGGGVQTNPNTSLESIISGGSTGETTPIDKVNVPVTPASVEGSPASNDKDKAGARPLHVSKPPARKKYSDRALVRKIHGEIVHDLSLPQGSKDIKVSAAAGKVTLIGTTLNEDDKYEIAAKASLLVGPENVVNLIDVKPAAPPQ
jgi:hypothetical protein